MEIRDWVATLNTEYPIPLRNCKRMLYIEFVPKRWSRGWRWLLLCLLLAASILVAQRARAHGGVVITSGLTDKYEWLVALDPYPLTPGITVITLLIYETQTYQPATDFTAELYLAAPGSSQPCCEEGVHLGPLPLNSDPALYPGDYSTVVNIEEAGGWAAKFVATRGDDRLEVPITFQVEAGDGPSAPPMVGNVNAAATATVFAQNVAIARQTPAIFVSPLSPLGQPVSPLVISMRNQATGGQPLSPLATPVAMLSRATTLPFIKNWPLWGGLALLPIVVIFIWVLRPQGEET